MADLPSSDNVTTADLSSSVKMVWCTYPGCGHRFSTNDQMKKHKQNKHEFYCKKCDYDGLNWDDLLGHKVEDMIPWLVGEKKHWKPKLLKHIVCEFCGMDFKSLGGRDLHKKQSHQADQQIKCDGSTTYWDSKTHAHVVERCDMVFGRASQLVAHITRGHCRFIKARELETERQQKMIVKEIMKDPEQFAHNLRGNIMFLSDKEKALLQGVNNNNYLDNDDEESGGIKVGPLDDDDTSQAANISSLPPNKRPANVMDDPHLDLPISRAVLQDPKLSEELSRRLGNVSLGPTRSSSGGHSGPPTSLSTVFGHHHTLASAGPSVGGTQRGESDTGSVSGVGDSTASSTPWAANTNTSKLLFPDAKKTDWNAVESAKEWSRQEDKRTNLVYSRFWDPSHEEWDPNNFRDPITANFACPFIDCGSSFETRYDIATHFRDYHIDTTKYCKMCYRTFKDAPALISHFESSTRGGKCPVANREDFLELLDEASGGFLSAKRVVEAKVWGLQPDKEKSDGIRSFDYTSQLPVRVTEARMKK